MKHIAPGSKLNSLILAAILLLSGCSHELVKDDTVRTSSGTDHCSGSEWTDDSSLAVIPIPVVAFFSPHTDLHDINADNYLKRCGDVTRLVNRKVEVGHGACVPASLTRVLTLGIWQWCPAYVSWEADVRQ
jgi:PBP1b-binding outer membrane lipoprotein LpoB